MGDYMCNKVLIILAGLALIGGSMGYFVVDPWLVVGVLMLLFGIMPFVYKGDHCGKKK